jgi:hypothetical protein
MSQGRWQGIAVCIVCLSAISSSRAAEPAAELLPSGEDEVWVGVRQEFAFPVGSNVVCVLPRLHAGVGMRTPRSSFSVVFDNGPLFWTDQGRLDTALWMSEFSVLPARRFELSRGAFRIGPRIGIAVSMFTLYERVTVNAPAGEHVYGSFGCNMAWEIPTADKRGALLRLAVEPALVIPWVVVSLNISLAVLSP